MCGIAGLISPSQNQVDLHESIVGMTRAIIHRGPDDEGFWCDPKIGLALGFRRLSILDLSREGSQPMESACRRYIVIFNGEIYNYADIQRELLQGGYPFAFRGTSDTEVLLAAVSHWGLETTLKRVNGMFALVLWDKQNHTLLLARDRMGKKPLYYGWRGNTFLFGSELKALKQHPSFRGEIDLGALALYFRHGYIPSPHTIYKSVYKLPPGSFLTIRPNRPETQETPSFFWSARDAIEKSLSDPFTGSETEAIDGLESLLKSAVGLRMVSDVPLGAFLSGGIDSSTVVAIMQSQLSRPVQTFSIGFDDLRYDESCYAKEVAKHLGTDHTELILSPQQTMECISRLPHLYDEPFSDSSQIPTFLVSQLAKSKVTVSLSGDGGDELFSGYNRYVWGEKIWNFMDATPMLLRSIASHSFLFLSPQTWDALLSKLRWLLPKPLRVRNPADKIHKLSNILRCQDMGALYLQLISHWDPKKALRIYPEELETALSNRQLRPDINDFTEMMMYFDLIMYLPDDILTKVDRATMGVGLEARAPLLDFRIVEFAWRLPQSLKIRNWESKWCLRRLLDRYVPRHLVERPKMGFALPMDAWLRGPLREWGESLIGESRLIQEGFLNPTAIRQKWAEHQSAKRNWQSELWDVLMFQSWLDSADSPGTLATSSSL